MTDLPKKVKIVEVGPRDGLQSEPNIVDLETKVEFINRLSTTGLTHIEVSSFVNPKRIPQLADAESVFEKIDRSADVLYSALVPNASGMERAMQAKAGGIAVFTAASETFCQKNIRCSIAESLDRFRSVIHRAQAENIPTRAYISCVLGCPYEGFVDASTVRSIAFELEKMGCDEISLGDTIGKGTPLQAKSLIEEITRDVAINQLAVHFHDTRGQALANILACLELGISTIDASVAGLGGCPFAEGASGNVPTEDVVYMLQGMDIDTGVDLHKLIATGHFISEKLARNNMSRVGIAGLPG